jgi:ech hydrogenase subunit A
MEKLHISVKTALAMLLLLVIVASVGITQLFNIFIEPQLKAFNLPNTPSLVGRSGGVWLHNSADSLMGGFATIPFFLIIFAIMITIPYFLRKTKPDTIKQPYMCGENVAGSNIQFVGPADKSEQVVVRNYYMSGTFGEDNLTLWTNLVAGAIILVMFGVVII